MGGFISRSAPQWTSSGEQACGTRTSWTSTADYREGVVKLSVTLLDFMEQCGGKRSATPLWLERLVLKWIRHKHQPKRRRASLAAALHMAVADTLIASL